MGCQHRLHSSPLDRHNALNRRAVSEAFRPDQGGIVIPRSVIIEAPPQEPQKCREQRHDEHEDQPQTQQIPDHGKQFIHYATTDPKPMT